MASREVGCGVIANNVPAQVGEVLVVGEHRLIVVRELTRAEFESLQAAIPDGPGTVSGDTIAPIQGSVVAPENVRYARRPSSDAKYFYAVRVEMARGEIDDGQD